MDKEYCENDVEVTRDLAIRKVLTDEYYVTISNYYKNLTMLRKAVARFMSSLSKFKKREVVMSREDLEQLSEGLTTLGIKHRTYKEALENE